LHPIHIETLKDHYLAGSQTRSFSIGGSLQSIRLETQPIYPLTSLYNTCCSFFQTLGPQSNFQNQISKIKKVFEPGQQPSEQNGQDNPNRTTPFVNS
jgi:hypothetical protein